MTDQLELEIIRVLMLKNSELHRLDCSCHESHEDHTILTEWWHPNFKEHLWFGPYCKS